MATAKTSHIRQQGFTLIELSIVLVIIGLIVGGVLVGQDLIKAAQIRATVGQLEKYDAAVNTFRNKYNGLPGDLLNAGNFFTAATDLPSAANCAGAVAGNGIFEDCAGTRILLSGEVAAFWRQLYLANLIAEPITNTNLIGGTGAAPTAAVVSQEFPVAKVGGYILAYTGGAALVEPGMPGSNLYRVGGLASTTAAGAPTLTRGLTPLQAMAIDAKKDDGVPNSGVVQATDIVAAASFNVAADTAAAAASSCVAVAGAYNTSVTDGNSALCNLLARGSF